MKRRLLIILGLCFATPALAHHSLALYDSTKPVMITGTVTKVEWINPHVRLELSVKKEDGTVTVQRIQMASAVRLATLRVDKNILAIGTPMTFEVWLPKTPGSDVVASGRSVTLPDGRQFDVSDNWGMAIANPQVK